MSDYEAKQAITEVLYQYCRAMDRIDSELGYSVWHDDGTAHYGGTYQGSGRGFIDWVCEVHRAMQATSHQVANILIQVNGDTAVSEAYVTARLRTGDGQTDLMNAGRYLDTWSHRDGRWAIQHRQYVCDIAWTRPVPEEDRQDTPFTPGVPTLASRPDRNDPSYVLLPDTTNADTASQPI